MSSSSPKGSSWLATGLDWFVAWQSTEPHLEGTDRVIDAILEALSLQDVVRIGPGHDEAPSKASSSLAVLAVLRDAAGSEVLSLTGDLPTHDPIPKGAVP